MRKIYEIINKGKGVITTITPQNLLLISDEYNGTTPNLSQVLMVGDREVVFSDGDGETILDVPHVGKIIDNSYNADDFLLPLSLFPIGSVLKIYNNGDVDLYCIPSDEQFDIIINDGSYNEFAPVKLKGQATAILTKIDESPFLNEIWKLTYQFSEEVLPTKISLELYNVDNTADIDKPVSTAQAAADLATLNSAKLYSDNESAKGSVFAVIDEDIVLTGQMTFNFPGFPPYTTFPGQSYLMIGRTDLKLNGVYVCNYEGAWQRRSDMRDGVVVSNSSIFVQAFNYAGSAFGLGQNKVIGTSNLIFSIITPPPKTAVLVDDDYFVVSNSQNKYEKVNKKWSELKTQIFNYVNSNLNDVRRIKVNDTTTATITGSTDKVLAKSYSFLANEFKNGFLDINVITNRTASSNFYNVFVVANTVNDPSPTSPTAVQLLQDSTGGNFSPYLQVERKNVVKSSILFTYPNNVNAHSDRGVTSSGNYNTFNIAAPIYIFVFVQLTNVSSSVTVEGVSIIN